MPKKAEVSRIEKGEKPCFSNVGNQVLIPRVWDTQSSFPSYVPVYILYLQFLFVSWCFLTMHGTILAIPKGIAAWQFKGRFYLPIFPMKNRVKGQKACLSDFWYVRWHREINDISNLEGKFRSNLFSEYSLNYNYVLTLDYRHCYNFFLKYLNRRLKLKGWNSVGINEKLYSELLKCNPLNTEWYYLCVC